jgi:hypothetical protein
MDPAYDHFGAPGGGSAYGTGPYAGGVPYAAGGSQIQGFQSARGVRDPMGITQQSGVSEGSKSYQRYTETSPGGAPVGFGIDPENGIAPRRLTDCVCAVAFVLYVLGMIILLIVVHTRTVGARPYGDVMRLSRGFDAEGRLCGVDAGVEDKAYLFWCREVNSENQLGTGMPVDEGLNLWNPSCVSACPNAQKNVTVDQVSCLYGGQFRNITIPGGQFGNVKTFQVTLQQSMMETAPYDTAPFGGHYCMPLDESLKASILDGPLHLGVRLVHKIGSFGDAWGVLFLASALAVALGYLFVLLIKDAAKQVVYGVIVVAYTVCLVTSLFFLYGVFYEIPGLKEVLPFDWYMELNPIYTRATGLNATIGSAVIGGVAMMVSCGLLGLTTHLKGLALWELVEAAAEAITAMRSMLIPPALEALWKYVLMWILCYNFRILLTVGFMDDHRVLINGVKYKGLSARFHYDWSMVPWIGYYLYGAVWIMELCNAFGHFLVAFAVISWYFMRKEGREKTGVPPAPPCHATFDGVVYHAGSLCLGAAIIPWTRVVRVWDFVVHNSHPGKDAECCDACHVCNGVVKCLGGLCEKLQGCVDGCASSCSKEDGCSFKYTKNAYCDTIIRSQHFLDAADRSLSIIKSHKYCKDNMYKLEVISVIGVLSIGMICSFFTHVMIMSISWYNDPTSSSYIDDPLAVDALAFLLCGNIAYGFTMVFDHTADVLLYCYAWNRKFNKKSMEKFVPELLKPIVAHDLDDDKLDYKLYGAAKPQMYLSSWLPKKKKRPGDSDGQAGYRSAAQTGGALDSQGYFRDPPAGSTYGGDAKYSLVSNNPRLSLAQAPWQYDGGQ